MTRTMTLHVDDCNSYELEVVQLGIGKAAISWHVGVIGLHGLHWTPFQALRACWHACPSCQSNVPM